MTSTISLTIKNKIDEFVYLNNNINISLLNLFYGAQMICNKWNMYSTLYAACASFSPRFDKDVIFFHRLN